MRHTKCVFHDILKLVPWTAFDKLAGAYGTDEAARGFTTRHQFIALLFAQLGGGSSPREVESVMASHAGRLYHAGANRGRDARVFSKLFEPMLASPARGVRRTMDDAARLTGKTSLHLAGVGAHMTHRIYPMC